MTCSDMDALSDMDVQSCSTLCMIGCPSLTWMSGAAPPSLYTTASKGVKWSRVPIMRWPATFTIFPRQNSGVLCVSVWGYNIRLWLMQIWFDQGIDCLHFHKTNVDIFKFYTHLLTLLFPPPLLIDQFYDWLLWFSLCDLCKDTWVSMEWRNNNPMKLIVGFTFCHPSTQSEWSESWLTSN